LSIAGQNSRARSKRKKLGGAIKEGKIKTEKNRFNSGGNKSLDVGRESPVVAQKENASTGSGTGKKQVRQPWWLGEGQIFKGERNTNRECCMKKEVLQKRTERMPEVGARKHGLGNWNCHCGGGA